MLDSFLAKYRESVPSLSAGQVAALEAHLALLERWNRTINLTAIKGKKEAIFKHIGESLFLAGHLPPGPLRICDLGSGGGFPGIPVAIARPDCKVDLVESDVRKAVFLREASRKLPNVSVLNQRFESVQGEYDWLISRAVNLSKTFGGPRCKEAAFLGAFPGVVEQGGHEKTRRTRCSEYEWRAIPIPWDPSSSLSIGRCFT